MRWIAALLLLAALLIGAVATDAPAPPADFTFVNRGDVNTLDPQRMSWLSDMRIGRMLFEPLVVNDPLDPDFAIAPGVADRWSVSEDGLVYTFHLRDDARWSNGAPVTADDFIRSWRRAMLPDLASDYTAMFQLVDGAAAFFSWRVEALETMASASRPWADGDALWRETIERFDAAVGLEAPDDHTLIVRLARPAPYFIDLCASVVFAPIYPPLVERFETPDPATGRIVRREGWTKPDQLVSNGPFRLDRWRFKRDMRFSQNPHYWNRHALNLRTIEVLAIEDPSTAVLAFESGAIDWIPDVTADYRAEMWAEKQRFYADNAETYARLADEGHDPFTIDRLLPEDPRNRVHVVPVLGTYFYNFNCSPRLDDGRENPLADARVRRALAMAIDKRAITEQLRRLGEPVASSVVPPRSLSGYTPPAGLESVSGHPAADATILTQARSLLRAAGYEDPRDLGAIEISFNEDAGHGLIAQLVARNWSDNLGIHVTLEQTELRVFRDHLKNHSYMVGRAGWYADYPDPLTFLDINRTGDGNNDRAYSSERFDGLLDRAATEPDPAERLALLREAERIIVEEDLPLVPLFHYVDIRMFDPHRVTGLTPHPRAQNWMTAVDVLGDGVGAEEPRSVGR